MHPPISAHLRQLLRTARKLRLNGEESAALALGPDILRAHFASENGYELSQDTPKTFREKLFRRMLDVHQDGAPLFSRLSDKAQVRSYVAEKAGEQYLTRLLWKGTDAADIPWDVLPDACVLKCTEGSGKNRVLGKPWDPETTSASCATWQADSYYWFRREYHYYEVPRHLLIEEMLTDGHPDGPIDYIFFCFDGIPRLIQVGSRSHTIHRFFTPAWQPVELSYRQDYSAPDMPPPARLDDMLALAALLSSGFDFVRIDLYSCGATIKFGEMTFTPRAGYLPFRPDVWNDILGEYWTYRSPGQTGR